MPSTPLTCQSMAARVIKCFCPPWEPIEPMECNPKLLPLRPFSCASLSDVVNTELLSPNEREKNERDIVASTYSIRLVLIFIS